MGNDKKELVAFCGLYCGDCFMHKGVVADLARDLRKELRQTKFDDFAKEVSKHPFFRVFKDYRQCYGVLGGMVRLRCKHACKGGGGPPFCKMRKCCQKKGLEGCWECDEFETCEILKDTSKTSHGVANIKNLRIIKKKGISEFIKGKRHW